MQNTKRLTKISIVSLSMIASLSISLMLTAYSSQYIYPSFVKYFHLNDLVGLTVEEVTISYQDIISFLLIPKGQAFHLSYFKSSPQAIVHFEDVKVLFMLMGILGLVAFLCVFILKPRLTLKRHRVELKQYFNMGLVLPLVALSCVVFFFDKIFLFFHEIFFQNDYWLFDPATDPIILVLPQSFFLVLSLLWMLGYCLWLVIFKYVLTK